MTRLNQEVREEWLPIYNAAIEVITQVLLAGEEQRILTGKPTNQWHTYPSEKRIHHAFMHMVACMTHQGTNGNPWSLTDNTSMEDYKHALTGLAIVAAREGGFMDAQVSEE